MKAVSKLSPATTAAAACQIAAAESKKATGNCGGMCLL
jgi:hypothetical protein